MSNDPHPNEELFWELAKPHLKRPEVERSTMMGSPCLRSDGYFYATVHRKTKELIVKLPKERVDELIEQGVGEEFKPAGKVFREWLAVSALDESRWGELLEEARTFASS